MEELYFVSLTLITAASLYVNFRGRNGSLKLLLSPSLILAVSFYLYSIALPLSRILFDRDNFYYPLDPELDNLYMLHHFFAAAGILAGLVMARSALNSKPTVAPIENKSQYLVRNGLFFTFICLMIVSNIYHNIENLGGIENILQPYGFISAEGSSNVSGMDVGSIYDVLGAHLLIVPLVLFFSVQNKRTALFYGYYVSVALGLFFLIRGNRNLLGMLFLPIITLRLLGKTVSVKQLVVSILGIFLFLYTAAFVRNFNFGEVGSVLPTIQVGSFDPLAGEFATNYSVYTKYKDTKLTEGYLCGKTYTIDAVVNIIPRSIWPSRPLSAGANFSMLFHGALGDSKGLGFSPVVEALVNFGTWGIFPIFCLTAVFVCWFEKWLLLRGPAGVASYAFLLPMVVNWNRIDMATTIKMFLIFVLLAMIFKKALLVKRPIPRQT